MGYGQMPTGYYSKKLKEKLDPYHGMYTKKQLADLENETELVKTPIKKQELQKRVRETKGSGLTFNDPIGFVQDVRDPIRY